MRIRLLSIISVVLLSLAFSSVVEAQLLPRTTLSVVECQTLLDNVETDSKSDIASNIQNILGCAIKTGRIKFWMIGYYIGSLIKFLLSLAGLVSTLFMIVGGYWYVIGGVSEEKEKGKNTIKYAILGLIVSLLGYAIVTVVQILATS